MQTQPILSRFILTASAAVLCAFLVTPAHADTFGSWGDAFTIDFVTIGNDGAGLILPSIRWFSLADSLHHRLISDVPPGQLAALISSPIGLNLVPFTARSVRAWRG
jgi:hypothetical protein